MKGKFGETLKSLKLMTMIVGAQRRPRNKFVLRIKIFVKILTRASVGET